MNIATCRTLVSMLDVSNSEVYVFCTCESIECIDVCTVYRVKYYQVAGILAWQLKASKFDAR